MGINSAVSYNKYNIELIFREGEETILVRKQLLAEQIEELRKKSTDINKALARLEYKLEHYDDHFKLFENDLRNE